MIDVVTDIEKLESALSLLDPDNAGDEKRAGINIIEKLLEHKKAELQLFEDTMAPLMPKINHDVAIDDNKFEPVKFRKAI